LLSVNRGSSEGEGLWRGCYSRGVEARRLHQGMKKSSKEGRRRRVRGRR
jgi:hypothetical protein